MWGCDKDYSFNEVWVGESEVQGDEAAEGVLGDECCAGCDVGVREEGGEVGCERCYAEGAKAVCWREAVAF